MTAQHLAHVEPLRRTALLLTGVIDLKTRLTDATLTIFCKYVESLLTKARGRRVAARLAQRHIRLAFVLAWSA